MLDKSAGAGGGIAALTPENPDELSGTPRITELEDGGMEFDFTPEDEEPKIDAPFAANLAEYLDESTLNSLGMALAEDFDNDSISREDWEKTFEEGLELLGLKMEERTTPWAGASGVHHPVLADAVVRYQSNAIMEIFPAAGPVRTQIVGKITDDITDQAQRVQEDMNYQLTEVMTEYRSETEKLLFAQPLAGISIRKVYWDLTLGRQVAMFVPAEDFVISHGTTSLETSPRYTHKMRKTSNEVRKLQAARFYRDIELTEPVPEQDRIPDAKNDINGSSENYNSDSMHTLLEMHVELDLEGFEDLGADGQDSGIALPYVVTIDKQSFKVLSIYRNWREEDPHKVKRQHFVDFPFIPGFGWYGLGYIHLIGGLTKSATSILRQLIDAGTLANLPGGLKAKGLRVKGEDTPIKPGEWRDIDVAGPNIRDSLFPMPYKEPSAVLFQLLGTVVDEGRRFASAADLEIGNGSGDAPVGTTLALMERAMKVMSAVQARLHASLRKEFRLIAELIKDNMPDKGYDYDVVGGARTIKKADYGDRVNIMPVSDPNAATYAQRVMQYQAALQLSTQAPGIYDVAELHRQMLHVLGLPDIDKLLPSTKDQLPLDPVSENMAILNGKPAKAFIYQDHDAHIAVHMSALQDPTLQQVAQANPAVAPAAMAHVAEHIAFKYRQAIEDQLGVALPPPGEPLPPEVEVQLSRIVAAAAQKLLAKNQNDAAQQAAQQQQQDPIIQMQMQDIQIKQAELQRKIKKDAADAALKQQELAQKQQTDAARIASTETIAGAQIGMQSASKQLDADVRREGIQSQESVSGAQIGAQAAAAHAQTVQQQSAADQQAQTAGAQIGAQVAQAHAQTAQQRDAAEQQAQQARAQTAVTHHANLTKAQIEREKIAAAKAAAQAAPAPGSGE